MNVRRQGKPMRTNAGLNHVAYEVERLKVNECRFPHGDPRTVAFWYCRKDANGPYCPDHRRLCINR